MALEVGDIVQVMYKHPSAGRAYGEIKEISEDKFFVEYVDRKGGHWWRAKHLRIVARGSGADIVPQVEIDRPEDSIKEEKEKSSGLIFSSFDESIDAWNTAATQTQWVTNAFTIPNTITHDQDNEE